MLYRPNFCCNCGEKIERLEWNLLTSRRFCIICSAENRRHDILPRLAVASGALALMFGIGSLWTGSGRAGSNAEAAVPIKSVSVPTAPDKTLGTAGEGRREVPPAAGVVTSEPGGTQARPETEERNEEKFSCGALTKKGTPCSRKVKSRGLRCFQHEGKPEAQPAE